MHIEFSHVYKTYKDFKDATALENVSFCIESEHRMIAIQGHNGAGKSTLLNLLAALDSPDSGRILVGEQDLTQLSRNALANYRLHEIGIVFQFFNLFPSRTIEENIALPGYLADRNRKALKKDVEKLAEEVEITHILKKYPHEVSGGQMQRAAIARALINHPKMLLADEPTGNLDTQSAMKIYDLLHRLAHEENVTIIAVTHDERMVKFAEKIIRMENGKVSI